MSSFFSRLTFSAALLVAITACGDDEKSCDPVARTGCSDGEVCEAVQGGSPACFAPLFVSGTVSDLTTGARLSDARVVALDANRSPLSKVAVTSGASPDDGSYTIEVPAPRDSSGRPVRTLVTLRSDRQGYVTFPGGVRVALPLDLSTATQATSGRWELSGPLTALELLPHASGGAAWIRGRVARPPSGAGALIVAEPAPGGGGPGTGVTGVADADGSYAIFNLAAGTEYVVTAYTAGTNYEPRITAALADGANDLEELALRSGATSSFSGNLIYNNGATSPISVALVLESTYVPNLDRGESPPGLAVEGGNAYAFSGVPDGDYVVLAAFPDDGNVRDVSDVGNTAAPFVTVSGGAVVGGASAIPGFKIIPAVDLQTIGGVAVGGAPVEVSTATPTFTWSKGSVDAPAGTYRVEVFDWIGNEVFSQDVPAAQENAVTYAGDPLQEGMFYQVRIRALEEEISVPASPTQLSQSEDLAGVFVYQP